MITAISNNNMLSVIMDGLSFEGFNEGTYFYFDKASFKIRDCTIENNHPSRRRPGAPDDQLVYASTAYSNAVVDNNHD